MFETALLSKADPAHHTNVVTNTSPGKIAVVVGHSSGLENPMASAPAIRQQLDRMLKSPVFAHSDRLSRFLRFTIEHVIGGTEHCLKEYVIGSEVYDRKPPIIQARTRSCGPRLAA